MKNTAAKRPFPPGRKRNFSGIGKFGGCLQTNSDPSKSAGGRPHRDVVEAMASLFEPDVLAAAQYFETFRTKTLIEPETRLLVAILEDAINCFYDNVSAESGKRKKLFNDAEEWVLEERTDWIFSFRNICQLLGLSAEYLRGGLMRGKEKRLARRYDLNIGHHTKMAV